MKRFLAMLLGCLLLAGCAMAEVPVYETLTSLDGFYGAWTVCASNGDIPYLVLHADQTYEAYDYWQLDEEAASGDALIRRGSYTFDPADGALRLEGYDAVYTAQTHTVSDGESYTSGDGLFETSEGMPLLLLYLPVTDEEELGDPSILLMPVGDDMPLLPTLEALSGNHEWSLCDQPAPPAPEAISYAFGEDGAVSILTNTPTGVSEAAATCTLEYGRMTLTLADGGTRNLLLQYHYILNDPENPSLSDEQLAYYNFAQAEESGWYTAVSYELLLVRDLDDGSVFYLVRGNG